MDDDQGVDPTLEDLSPAAMAERLHDRYRAKVLAGERLLLRQHRRRGRLGALWPWLLGLSVVMVAGVAAYLSVVIAAHHSTNVADYQALYGDDVQLRAEVGTLRAQLHGLGARPTGPAVPAAPSLGALPPLTPPPTAPPARRRAGSSASSSTTSTTRHSPPPPPATSTTTSTTRPPPPCNVSVPGACLRAP